MIKFILASILLVTTSALSSSVRSLNECGNPLDPSFTNISSNGYSEWKATATYENSVYLPTKSDPCNGMAFHWAIVSDKIKIAVAVKATGWSAIGFSETGGMRGADVVYFEAATSLLVDAHVGDGYTMPIADELQNWNLLGSTKTDDGYLIFEAERDLDTGDVSQDRVLVDDGDVYVLDNKLIGAWGDSDTISYHGNNRISTSMQLFPGAGDVAGNAYDIFQQDMTARAQGSVTLTLGALTIPTDETTYHNVCYTTNDLVEAGLFKDASSATHIIGFEFLVAETSVKYAHHMLLYGHFAYYNDDPDSCNDINTPLMGWAPGNDFFYFPEGSGMKVGNMQDSFNAFTLECHFNNRDGDANVVDGGTGVKIYYTNESVDPSLEIGMMMVGDPNVELAGNEIGSGRTMHEFTCPSTCTDNSFEDDEISIVMEAHHMHAKGKRMVNDVYRDGTLVHSAVIDYYDFDQSGVAHVRQQPYTVRRGDSFHTTCYFETNEDTVYGLGSQDEMCMTFLYYFPKQQNLLYCGPEGPPSCDADYASKTLDPASDYDRVFGGSSSPDTSSSASEKGDF